MRRWVNMYITTMKFKDLKVGDKFSLNNYGFIKIDYNYEEESGTPLLERTINAICLNNKHHCIIGPNVDIGLGVIKWII